jgi:hypothetical protein
VFRKYLDAELQLHSLKKTNEEIIYELRSQFISDALRAQLNEALRISDFVKFAKYQPDEAMNQRSFEIIQNAIQSLHKNSN